MQNDDYDKMWPKFAPKDPIANNAISISSGNEINFQSDTPLNEIDPDMQFHLGTNYIKNTKCDW